MRIGVVGQALSSDPREAALAARRTGFEGLQFEGAGTSVDIVGLSASGRREFRRVLSSQDQALVGLRADVGPRGFGPGADVDFAIARVSKLMEAAAGLAAPLLCVDLGPLPTVVEVEPPRPKVDPATAGIILLPDPASKTPPAAEEKSPPPDPAFVSQVHAALDELGRRADRYSCVLAFRSELSSLASLRAAVSSVNCPWFGVDLDPVAAVRDAWDLDEIFSRLGPLVRHVRGREAVVGAQHRTQPARIGHGSVDWQSLLANLDSAGFHGWVTLDPAELTDRAAGAAAGLAYLRAVSR